MAVLMRRTEIWRAYDEDEAEGIIEDAISNGGELTKKIIEVKQKKSKGEVIDENLKVTIQVDYAPQFENKAIGEEE